MRTLEMITLVIMTSTCASAQELSKPCACTREFRSISTEIVDRSGRPIEKWSAIVRLARTGEVLRRLFSDSGGVQQNNSDRDPSGRTRIVPEVAGAPGRDVGVQSSTSLLIADDGMLEVLKRNREELSIEVRSGKRRGAMKAVIGTTGSNGCRCHVSAINVKPKLVVR